MARKDDIFDELWDSPPQESSFPKNDGSKSDDMGFLSDNPHAPPKKKPQKKRKRWLWILLPVLAGICVLALILVLLGGLFSFVGQLLQPPTVPQFPSYGQISPTLPVIFPTEPDTQTEPPLETEPVITPTQPTVTPSQPTAPTEPVVPPTQPTDPTPANVPYRHLYQSLSAQEKQLYLQVLAGLEQASESIGPFHFADEKAVDRVMQAIRYDCPEIFWFTGSYPYTYYTRQGYLEVTFNPKYHWSRQECMQNKAYVANSLRPLIQQLSGLSDYDKVMGVHEYLIDNTAYTPSYRGKTIYEMLHDGKAVCEGYARATQYLLHALDVPVIYIYGDAVSSSGQRDTHTWNMVQIDGQWYLLDVTWDDPYFPDGTQEKYYTYFCITTEEMNRNHVPELNVFPNCTAIEANYFTRNGRYLSSYDTDLLSSWISQDAGKGVLSFKCANRSIYSQVYSLLKNGKIRDYGSIRDYSYTYDDTLYIITLFW